MRLSGVRKATISEYIYTFKRLVDAMKIEYVDDIKLESIFGWLASLGIFQMYRNKAVYVSLKLF